MNKFGFGLAKVKGPTTITLELEMGQKAVKKINARENAVQLYTGMVYKGPGIVKIIKKELISILKKEDLKNTHTKRKYILCMYVS